MRLRGTPETLYLSRGRTVLATDREGSIRGASTHGLYVHETRLLSRHAILVDGKPPVPVARSNVEPYSWLGYYLIPARTAGPDRDDGSGQIADISQQSVEVRVSRVVGEGWHEDLDITNLSQRPTAIQLDVELSADFADRAETTIGRVQVGNLRDVVLMTRTFSRRSLLWKSSRASSNSCLLK